MTWLDQIKEGFPPPREGEPANLRRDIADELDDHLTFALARERERTGDEAQARRAALNQFGDPRHLAHRLWLDAMKERIMRDRLMIVAIVLVAAASVAASIFAWKSFQQAQQTNQAMLASLEQLVTATREANLSEANPNLGNARIKVLSGPDGEQPVAGIEVQLHGEAFQEDENQILTELTDDDGTVNFGPVLPGIYGLILIDQMNDIHTDKRINWDIPLYAGRTSEETIRLPHVETGAVEINILMTDEIEFKEFFIGLYLKSRMKADDGTEWQYSESLGSDGFLVGMNEDGTLFGFSWVSGPGRSPIIKLEPSPISDLELLAWDYQLLGIFVGLNPESSGDGQTVYKTSFYFEFDDASSRPTYEVSENVSNQWNVELPEKLFKAIPFLIAGAGHIPSSYAFDDQLIDLMPGRPIRILNVNKTKFTTKDGHSLRGLYNLTWAVANMRGGSRGLFNWPAIGPEVLGPPGRRALLAAYSYETTSVASAGRIQVFEVIQDWRGGVDSSWIRQESIGDLGTVHDFVPGEGWKFFDVTSIIRAQIEEARPPYGVMLKFDDEDRPTDQGQWAAYRFVAVDERHDRDYPMNRRPLLIIVEPDE